MTNKMAQNERMGPVIHIHMIQLNLLNTVSGIKRKLNPMRFFYCPVYHMGKNNGNLDLVCENLYYCNKVKHIPFDNTT